MVEGFLANLHDGQADRPAGTQTLRPSDYSKKEDAMRFQAMWMLSAVVLLVAGMVGCSDKPRPVVGKEGEPESVADAISAIEKLGGTVFSDDDSGAVITVHLQGHENHRCRTRASKTVHDQTPRAGAVGGGHHRCRIGTSERFGEPSNG